MQKPSDQLPHSHGEPPAQPPAASCRRKPQRKRGSWGTVPRAFSSPSVSGQLSSPRLQAAATRDVGTEPHRQGLLSRLLQATWSPAGFSPQHSSSIPCPTEARSLPTDSKGWTSLVVQWLRLRSSALPMQRAQVRSLVRELDSTCYS